MIVKITISGPQGAGKTTIARFLQDALKEQQLVVPATHVVISERQTKGKQS